MTKRWLLGFVSLATLATLLVGGFAPAVATTNFNESRGCGVAGYRGPLAGRDGWLPTSQQIYGPFADYFGRNYSQVSAQMVDWTVPGSGGRTVKVHIDALPAFQQVTENLAAAAAEGKTYRVDSAFGWGFRTVTGESERMSFHAFGAAVDINPPRNPYVPGPDPPLITDMPPWYVKAWTDAGFCWGGDWVSIKDAMHFSWMGPHATPGYGDRPAPSPATTSSSQFNRLVFDGVTAFAGAEWTYDVFDRSRDGAPDLYGWRWLGDGLIRIEVAGAVSGYTDIGIRESVAVEGSPATHGAFFGDYDGDSRADLWVHPWGDGRIKVYADTGEGEPFTDVVADFAFNVPSNAVIMAGHYDADGVIDLYLVRGSGQLQVFDGASGYATKVLDVPLGARPLWNRLDLADYGLDGVADVYAMSNGSQGVYIATSANGLTSGPAFNSSVSANGSAQLADFDGDGRPDIYQIDDNGHLKVYLGGNRPAGADLTFWYESDSLWDAGPECFGPNDCDQIGYVDAGREFSLRDNLSWDGGDYEEFFFGNPGDISLVGDWDCDGVSTPGMFRPSNGFAYLTNEQLTSEADLAFFFGKRGDIPIVGDWDGNGCDSLGIYRPSQRRFYLSNTNETRPADFSFRFGLAGDRPLSGDFNGDGRDDYGVYRPSAGRVLIRFVPESGPPDLAFYFGNGDDTLIVGDWDGDGIDTLGVHRNDEGRWYFRLENTSGIADHVLRAGPRSEPVDPVVGVW